MKETKTRKMTRQTSALLLAGILCVSAVAGNASAQGKSETDTQASQTQQVEKENPSDSASAATDEAAKDTAAAGLPQTVKVVPGNCVRFTVHVDKDADTKDTKASDGAEKVRIDVEVLEKADPAVTAKEEKKENDNTKDTEEKKSSKKEESATSAEAADKTEKAETITYSWQVDRQNGQGWKNLFRANGDSYQIRKVTQRQNGWEYRCIITNEKGSIECASVKLELGDSSVAADSADNGKKTN